LELAHGAHQACDDVANDYAKIRGEKEMISWLPLAFFFAIFTLILIFCSER
jgi:hypothetical protein